MNAGPAIIIDEPEFAADGREPFVGVVAPQMQAVLGPAGEHPIRFDRRLGHQIINQHADIRLIATKNKIRVARRHNGRR